MRQFDPLGPLEEIEEAFRRLDADKPEQLRFFAFTAALLVVAIVCLMLRG